MEAHGPRRLRTRLPSNWETAVLVCRKCSKKLDGGFGPKGDERLAKELRKRLHLKKGRKAAAGIIEVGCLGVCPKGAVTVVNGSDAREWMLVRPGDDLALLSERLGLAPASTPSAVP